MLQLRGIFHGVLLALGMFAGLGVASSAHAVAGPSTFYWSGNCLDCTALGDPGSTLVTGTLTLNDYELGDPIFLGDDVVAGNFGSFSYSGSNLVFPYTVMPGDAYFVAGAITNAEGANHFEVEFIDGHFFRTYLDGAWSTCATGVNGFYTTTSVCDLPADFGNASVYSLTPVPEPGIWAMLAAGLGLIGWMRRRGAAPAAG